MSGAEKAEVLDKVASSGLPKRYRLVIVSGISRLRRDKHQKQTVPPSVVRWTAQRARWSSQCMGCNRGSGACGSLLLPRSLY